MRKKRINVSEYLSKWKKPFGSLVYHHAYEIFTFVVADCKNARAREGEGGGLGCKKIRTHKPSSMIFIFNGPMWAFVTRSSLFYLHIYCGGYRNLVGRWQEEGPRERKDKGNKCFTKSLSFLVMLACVRRYDEVLLLASKMGIGGKEERKKKVWAFVCDGCHVYCTRIFAWKRAARKNFALPEPRRFQLFDGLRGRDFVPTRETEARSCQELSRVSINCAGNFVEYRRRWWLN